MIVEGFDCGTNSVVDIDLVAVDYDDTWSTLALLDAKTGCAVSVRKLHCPHRECWGWFIDSSDVQSWLDIDTPVRDVYSEDEAVWLDEANAQMAGYHLRLGRRHEHALEGDVIPGFHDNYYELEQLPCSYALSDWDWLSEPVDLRPNRLVFDVSDGMRKAYIITNRYGEGQFNADGSQLLGTCQYRLPKTKATLRRQLKRLLDGHEVI